MKVGRRVVEKQLENPQCLRLSQRFDFIQEQREPRVLRGTPIDRFENIQWGVWRQGELERGQQARWIVILLVQVDPAHCFARVAQLLRPLHHERGLAVAGSCLDQD